jgi:uncharacterized RDD family membrane protein YckC
VRLATDDQNPRGGRFERMKWYYADGTAQAGPVTEPEIESLFQSGKIQPSTLVWHEGMGSWLAFGQVKPALVEAVQHKSALTEKRPLLAPDLAPKEVVCSQCNQIFARGELILIRESWVCANCKPAFVQKLKEGSIAGPRLEYASFGIRLVAKLLDNFIFNTAIALIAAAAASLLFSSAENFREELAVRGVAFFGIVLGAVLLVTPIKIWCLARKGGTPGKRLCKLRVISASGENIGWGQATGRVFAEWITQLTFTIGYIIAAFDTEKRTVHDHIAGTRVVKD